MFYTILLTSIVILAILLLIIRHYFFLQFKKRKWIEQGIVLTVHLQRIISFSQKHRGTTNALHSGNTDLRKPLLQLQADLEKLVYGSESKPLNIFPQWESFLDHWPRLKLHSIKGDLAPHLLVRQHTLMIDGQLSLIDDVMRHHNLHKMMLDSKTRVSQICLDSLRVAEIVGQTRAIGSGVCASGICEGVERLNLDFLVNSVKYNTRELLTEMRHINNDGLKQQLDSTCQSITETTQDLVVTVEQEVLKKGQLEMNSDDYFTISTKVIDEVLKVFGIVIHYASKKHLQLI